MLANAAFPVRIVSAGLLLSLFLSAQERPPATQANRIAGRLEATHWAGIKGNIHPKARPEYDRGPVDPALQLDYVVLALKPSPVQQTDLDRLLAEEQNPRSPNFHKWLTPEQFADRFGASPSDMAQIAGWLESQGLAIVRIARGRNFVAFKGSAAQVEAALHVELHRFLVDGELHFANATEPSVPEAIRPFTIGFLGLDDFLVKPSPLVASAVANFTTGTAHTLAPGDIASIYDVAPLYGTGIDGSGQKLAIIGQSNVNLADIRAFRAQYGLSANDPVPMLVPGSADPGIRSGDATESDLDLEWSGAVARNAQIIFVYSSSVRISAMYAIDNAVAPVISYSYSACELGASSVYAASIQPLAQQANLQGITWIASSGDSGAAACDAPGRSAVATNGIAVNLPASVPEVTGVGGTSFNEGGGNYWSPSNATDGGSALSYIPEAAWNEGGAGGVVASGGGMSVLFAHPAWQSAPGVPGDNARFVPDVSLAASGAHDAYNIVTGGATITVGGTSASAPVFAGIVLLMNQYLGVAGLGNINPNLYRMAATANVFHDVTSGDNIVACAAGTNGCVNGTLGYTAGPGFDMVTGLGSIDAFQMISQWSTKVPGTTMTVTATPSVISLNGITHLTATVAPMSGSGVPTGQVSFQLGSRSLGTAQLFFGGGVALATITASANQFNNGSNLVTAIYEGDPNFSGSTATVTVTANLPVNPSAVVPSIVPNPVYQEATDSAGYSWFYTIHLQETAGVATTLTGLTIDGADESSSILSFFGTASIPAGGSISSNVRAKNLAPPVNRVFIFSGTDVGGRQWTQQITVPFNGPAPSNSLTLGVLPSTISGDPNASPSCEWFQNLGLQELSGHTVYLTHFFAAGFDDSANIAAYFGGTIVPANGSLLGGVCWRGVSTPAIIRYEIDGVDDTGAAVATSFFGTLEAAPVNPGLLTVSSSNVLMSLPDATQSTTSTFNVNIPAGQGWSITTFPTATWISVSPASGIGPGPVTVSVAGSGLAPGLYQTNLFVESVNVSPPFAKVAVNVVVGQPAITQIFNAASYVDSGLSPGLIFSVKGTGLGPTIGQSLILNTAGNIATSRSGVQVLVDGTPAPILYASSAQINAVAPYELASKAGQTVAVQVINNGVSGNSISDSVVATAPAMFNIGNNQAAVINQDGTINGATNPAARGSYISIYATGEGQTTPAGVDGLIPFLPSRPNASVSVSMGALNAQVLYAGTASFDGFFQVNAVLPLGLVPGAVPLTLSVGGVASPVLNVYVK